MVDQPLHSVAVTGVVFRDGGERVLAIQRTDDCTWVVPGGILELDESPQAGCSREVWEETGMVIRPIRLTGVYKNVTKAIVTLAFSCAAISDYDVSSFTGPETRQVTWFTIEEAVKYMNQMQSIRILDAMNTVPVVRVHNGINVLL